MIYLYRKESKNNNGKVIMIIYLLTDHKTFYIRAGDITVLFKCITNNGYQYEITDFNIDPYGEPICVADSYQFIEQKYRQEYPEEFL
jgi:hypothetical protein